jgi:hypothetical protein
MRFCVIDPARRNQTVVSKTDLTAALRAAKLTQGAVDHGTITMPAIRSSGGTDIAGVAIVVSELGMFTPPESQSYFAINRKLYAGSAVLYGFDGDGKAVDLPGALPGVHWFRDHRSVETSIGVGIVIRPRIGYPGHTLWQWPGPRPSKAEREAFMAELTRHGGNIVFDGDTTIIVEPNK